MAHQPLPLCGFGHTILYYNCSAIIEYHATMRTFQNMTANITESYYMYVRSRKDYRNHLTNRYVSIEWLFLGSKY